MSYEDILEVMAFMLDPQIKKNENIEINKETEELYLKENFINVLFCTENIYEEFIVKKGNNKKSKYDYIYSKQQLLIITNLLNSYRINLLNHERNPFPIDRYEFQFQFFDFLQRTNTNLKILNMLVKDNEYLQKFIFKLDEFSDKINNKYFHDENTKTELIRLLDDFAFEIGI